MSHLINLFNFLYYQDIKIKNHCFVFLTKVERKVFLMKQKILSKSRETITLNITIMTPVEEPNKCAAVWGGRGGIYDDGVGCAGCERVCVCVMY